MAKNIGTSTRKTRLALCLEYPIEQRGGTEVLVRQLIDGFADKYELVLVSDDAPEILAKPVCAGKIQKHLRWQPDRDPIAAHQLATSLHAAGVDIAHFHLGGTFCWNTRLAPRCPIVHLHRLGVACIATNHGVFGLFDGYIGPQRSFAVKLALLPAAWLSRLVVISHLMAEVAVSRADYRALRSRYWPLRRKMRQIYHTRLHIGDFAPATKRDKIVLCSGTIAPRKAQWLLVEAFAKLAGRFPEWRLVIVGRAGESKVRENMEAALRQVAGAATWIEDCSDQELTDWYRRAEIFAMPSLHEGLGLSLQEALFHGCACVASDVGGIPDLIQPGENGLLTPVKDVPALAAALARLMDDDALRRRFQARAHSSVVEKEMTVEQMLAKYSQLYDEATSSRS